MCVYYTELLALASAGQKTIRTPTNVNARICCGSKPLVGVTRLELVASWSRTKHATKLRYTPKHRRMFYYSEFVIFCQAFFLKNS